MSTHSADLRVVSPSATGAAVPGPRRHRWPWVVVAVLAGLVLVFHAAGGYYFSDMIYREVFEARDEAPEPTQTGSLTRLGGGSVAVTLDEDDAVDDDFANAVVGIDVGDALVVAGPVASVAGAESTRPILDVVGALPRATGQPVAIQRNVWTTPEQAGMGHEDVSIVSGGGQYPAWLIPAEGADTWAVLLHGKHGQRSEMLRMAVPLHEAGITSLVVTYTGDQGVPAPPDGMWGYGTTELPEIEAAVRFAQDAGAHRVVLVGASHGAAVALGFLSSSAMAGDVGAVILDSPPADLAAGIDLVADTRRLPFVGLPIPESLEQVAIWMTEWRFGVDFDDYDHTARADEVSLPVLVLQGDADQTVPVEVARDLDAALGGGATYVEIPGGQHICSWNVDPVTYGAALRDFLSRLPT